MKFKLFIVLNSSSTDVVIGTAVGIDTAGVIGGGVVIDEDVLALGVI